MISGLDRYFDFPAIFCPSVNAAETLLAMVQEGPQLLDHFLETADPTKLLALIDVNLPLRASAVLHNINEIYWLENLA